MKRLFILVLILVACMSAQAQNNYFPRSSTLKKNINLTKAGEYDKAYKIINNVPTDAYEPRTYKNRGFDLEKKIIGIMYVLN